MLKLAILGDIHLLLQAEWLDDERRIVAEGKEVLDNFEQAISVLKKEKPDAVLLAGDIFDYRTMSRRRVAHREGEKYMIRIRTVLEQLADDLSCKIYALKGNHDSEAVLRSTEKSLKGKFVYAGNKTVNIADLNVFFMNSHYVPGLYEVPLTGVPEECDLLIMHESAPLWGAPAPSKENLMAVCSRFKLAFNGHMHSFQPKAVGIPNLYVIPAFIPSREIKNNWMLKYIYPDKLEPEVRKTPFGFILLEDEEVKFQPFSPSQIIVRAEVKGEKPEDFISGIKEVYDILLKRDDRERLRVWVETDADPITVDRVIWSTIRGYPDIQTVDVIRTKPELRAVEARPAIEFEAKAYTREELFERVLGSLKPKQRKKARRIFAEIFTAEYLKSRKPDEPTGFKKLLEIISDGYEVSEAFLTRTWELAKGRVS